MSFATIQRALAELQRGAQRQAVLRSGGWHLVAVLFACGLALLLAQAGWPRLGILSLLAALLAGLALWRWALPRSGRNSPMMAALLAEQLAPELGTAARSAVDLGEKMQSAGVLFSRDLAGLHLDRTADAMASASLEQRLRASEQRPVRRMLLALGAGALWTVALAASLDEGRGRLVAMLVHPGAARFVEAPLAGDIRITYRFPAYTGLAQRVVDGGDGSISAVAGTEVEVSATAESAVRSAELRMTDPTGNAVHAIPMQVVEGRKLKASLSVMRDGAYHFALQQEDGDRLEEQATRPIQATLDAYPEIQMEAPAGDVEIKDDKEVAVLWRAKDDFGVSEVNLVIERGGGEEPERISLAGPKEAEARREGRYNLAVAALNIAAGNEARFYLEAVDNDALSGPKRSVSAKRRLSLFSARRQHEDLLGRQKQLLDALVDWLGEDLEFPFSVKAGAAAIAAQQRIVERMSRITDMLVDLARDLYADELSSKGVAAAFDNVREHVVKARAERNRALELAARPSAPQSALAQLAERQRTQVATLEKDIIYLDDLLALQRLDELKQTAKDLLAAHRNLQELVDKYRQTQDPALRAALEQQIRELRQQMMELLAKMAQIKEGLPGEYRNLESSTMMELDDQMARMERMLREGDLESLAREVEQLANMVENMMGNIDRAEEEYGGERYAELRKELGDFAARFKKVESEQQTLAERSEQMLRDYRKRAMHKTGGDLDDFVRDLRAKAAKAVQQLEATAEASVYPGTNDALQNARQRLFDLDALLEQKDLAEAREVGKAAQQRSEDLERLIEHQARYGWQNDPGMKKAQRSSSQAARQIREINEKLDELFPDPSKVLSQEQLKDLQRMAKRQQSLQQQAEQLGQQMDELAQQLPLFGGEPRESLKGAEQEMGEAAGDAQGGELPGAAAHGRRAVEELAKLRQALEQASQGKGSGLPLPLAMGGRGSGRDDGNGSDPSRDEVEIPQADRNRADPRYRKELLEAAKQKAPERYEDSVRRYYQELIR